MSKDVKRALMVASDTGTRHYAKQGRIPELVDEAGRVQSGTSTAAAYRELSDKLLGKVWPYAKAPRLPTPEDIRGSLKESQTERVGGHESLPEGYPVDLRLDIPAYTHHGVWVPTIHYESPEADPVTGAKRRLTAYGSHAHVDRPVFHVPEKQATNVATGAPKSPFAVVRGALKKTPTKTAQRMANAIINNPDKHPEWRQVGMNPERHSFFYDRETRRPVLSADEALQVGHIVLAKNPKYGDVKDYPYARGGRTNGDDMSKDVKRALMVAKQQLDDALGARAGRADGGAIQIAKAGDRRVSPVNGPLESTGENITDDWREIGKDKDGKTESWRPVPAPKTSDLIMNTGGAARSARADGGPIPPFNLSSGAPDYSKPDDLGLYSHGAVVASKMPMAKGSPEQIKGYLTKQGVKPDEFKWSGYDEKLGGKPMVTREEVAKHFHENKPAIKEHVLGEEGSHRARRTNESTKYGDYTLPGGANYREHLLTLPEVKHRDPNAQRMRELFRHMETHGATTESAAEFDDLAARGYHALNDEGANYNSSHWDQPNVLAHLRLSDRDLPGNKKALHLEELQSDWAQEGRSKGFGGQSPEEASEMAALFKLPEMSPEQRARYDHLNAKRNGPIPQAPYVDSTSKWLDLGLKRALYEAAKGGHHKLVITPGEEQAKRYDLSKHFDKVHYFPKTKALQAYNPAGEQVYAEAHEPEELPNVVGKDVAERLLNAPKKLTHDSKGVSHLYHEVQGADLKVGGEGMKAFYDKLLPQALQKLAKRHDPAAEVKLHHHMLDTPHNWDHLTDEQRDHYAALNRNVDPKHHADYPGRQTGMHSLDITPTMRASILKGHPHFESGGYVKGGYTDPQSHHISDWIWRPMSDVQEELGDPRRIPSHVEDFGAFMDEMAHKAQHEGFSPRDLIKAFTITRASIQRKERPVEKIRAAGLILPESMTGNIRPEGAFAEWLRSPMGQTYLDHAEAGRVHEEAIADAQRVMKPFGKTDKDLPNALRWAALNLPGKEGLVSELVTRARKVGNSEPSEWREGIGKLAGIGAAKSGFLAGMLGRGDQPTPDARQLKLNTGVTGKASPAGKYMARGRDHPVTGGGAETVDRLAARLQYLNLAIPKELRPYYQHLAHHTTWDAIGNERTTHQDLQDTMRTAKSGGRIVERSLNLVKRHG